MATVTDAPAPVGTSSGRPGSPLRSRLTTFLKFALVLVLVAIAVVLVPRWFRKPAAQNDVHVVQPMTLNVTLEEDGELKPVNSVQLKCEIQSQSATIQWLVPESTSVKKGDLLVRLAAEDLRDRVEMEDIEVKKIAAALEEAQTELTITKSENESKVRKAEDELSIAQMEFDRYLSGDYMKAVKQADLNLQQDDITIKQLEDDIKKNEYLLARQFISQSKVDDLHLNLEKAQLTFELHKLERRILEDWELPKNLLQKRSALNQAIEEYERECQRALSRERQSLAKVQDQAQTADVRKRRFERLKQQLSKCEIYAPNDGIVQYGEQGEMFWRGNRVAVGERVYDGQTLITLPDTGEMMVTTRIHEADRHKVAEGLTCIVRVPAVPDRTFHGKLTKIAQFADSERGWLNPELKEHQAEVRLDDADPALSPGDTAHIEILIEQAPNVIAVPVQSVFARGAKRLVFVHRGLTPEPIEVKLGRSSSTMIEVTEGLRAGDKVLMAPGEALLALLPPANEDEGPTPKRKATSRPTSASSTQPSSQAATQPAGLPTSAAAQPTSAPATQPASAPASRPG